MSLTSEVEAATGAAVRTVYVSGLHGLQEVLYQGPRLDGRGGAGQQRLGGTRVELAAHPAQRELELPLLDHGQTAVGAVLAGRLTCGGFELGSPGVREERHGLGESPEALQEVVQLGRGHDLTCGDSREVLLHRLAGGG